MEISHLSQMLVIALVAGIFAQIVGSLFRLPSIVFLLSFGIALGPDGFAVFDPKNLRGGLELIVRLAVAIILFEGSMTLRIKHILQVQTSVRRLITFGVLITFVAGALVAHFVAGLPLRFALLFGALVTVTGPTVIRPIVQRLRVRREIKSILESEGILADPIGAILAVVCLGIALQPEGAWTKGIVGFGTTIGVGLIVGGVSGYLLGFVVKFRSRATEPLKNLIVMACVLGCYELSESFSHESGIMAVVAAGLTIQHGIRSYERPLREFKEQLTILLLSVLFILLSANLRLDAMKAVGVPGLVTVLILMFVIRPISVFFCTRKAVPTLKERIFLSWVAPRGIIAASIASLAAIVLARRGYAGEGAQVEALVFLTIFLTVFLQGGTARLFARLLGITTRDVSHIIVVGANPLGVALANGLRAKDREILLVDRNHANIERARAAGFQCIEGDATERAILLEAGIEETDSLLAVTSNTDTNQRIAYLAHHDFDVHHLWVGFNSIDQKSFDPLLKKAGAQILFGRAVPFDYWETHLRTGEARIVEATVPDDGSSRSEIGGEERLESALPLYFVRKQETKLCYSGTKVQPDDVLTMAIKGDLETDKVLRELTT